MRDNNNIEELFKHKFENFEGNVDPSAWNAIQQSVQGSSGATASKGMSSLTKVATIVGIAGATTAAIWYVNTNKTEEKPVTEKTESIDNQEERLIEESDVQAIGETILVADTSDPIVQEHKDEIEKELNNLNYTTEDIDEDLLETILSDNAFNDGFMVNQNNINPDANPSHLEEKEMNNEANNELTVNPIEKADVESKLQITYKEDNTISFSSNAKNHGSVEWDFGDGQTAIGDKTEHQYERPGTYEVLMTVYGDDQIHSNKKEIVIKGTSELDKIPNVFTPNGDGINDFFKIKNKGLDVFYVSIQDQQGNEVFTSNDPSFEWDGFLMDGTKAKGSYRVILIAEGEDGQIYKEMKALRIE